ncbi:hypothetical protein [Actinokineospora iranica]|nr:hypothetical protein [Actinokineospora iranica]
MWGFEPDAEFKVVPYSSEWDDFNPGATLTIDANGTEDFNRFHCKPAGQDVWVVVTIGDQTYTSNRFRWPG